MLEAQGAGAIGLIPLRRKHFQLIVAGLYAHETVRLVAVEEPGLKGAVYRRSLGRLLRSKGFTGAEVIQGRALRERILSRGTGNRQQCKGKKEKSFHKADVCLQK